MTEDIKLIAEAFVQARRSAAGIKSYPGLPPATLAQAYEIQDQAIKIDGRSISGWKVGRIFPPDDVRLGSNRIAGPIFADAVVVACGGCPAMPVFAAGFAAAEAEFLLHIAPGYLGRVPQNDQETLAILDDVRLGLEIASSPYSAINTDGPAVTASDFGNNAGLVVGASLANWRDCDLCAVEVRTEVEGLIVGSATAAKMLDGPLGAVRFLLAHLSHRGIDISQGVWVSTGAITGVHPVKPGQLVRAVFGAHGTVDCVIHAAIGQ